jgi:hypothetical protein
MKLGRVMPMRAQLADGTEIEATVDQRDWAALEAAQGNGTVVGSITSVRFLTWSALRRAKEYTGAWEKFNGTDCVHVEDLTPDDEDTGDEESLDPGLSDLSAGT